MISTLKILNVQNKSVTFRQNKQSMRIKIRKINTFNEEIMVDDTDGDFTLNQKKM